MAQVLTKIFTGGLDLTTQQCRNWCLEQELCLDQIISIVCCLESVSVPDQVCLCLFYRSEGLSDDATPLVNLEYKTSSGMLETPQKLISSIKEGIKIVYPFNCPIVDPPGSQ